MQGRLERRDAQGAWLAAVEATPARLRIGGRPPASPTPPLCPAPCALADLAGAGALHSEARGGAGPPHTAALRHESPTLPGTLGQGRGAHSLYLAGLDLFCPAAASKASSPLTQPHPWSHQSGLEGGASPFFSLRPCLSRPLSSVLSSSLLVSLFFCPMVVSSLSALPCLFYFSVQCPCLSRFPVLTIFRAGPTEGPDSSLYLPYPHNESPHKQNQIPLSEPGPSAAAELNFFLCLRRLC